MHSFRYSLIFLLLPQLNCAGFDWDALEQRRSQTLNTGIPLASPLADTGQFNCYDDASLQPCATVSATHPGQDGHFVNVPVARSVGVASPDAVYTNDYTTKDNVTGLIWKSCSENQTGAGCTGTASSRSWAQANTDCTALNANNSGAGFAGITTWRLPTVYEIRTISDYSMSNPPFSAAQFPNTAIANALWTSTPDAVTAGNYWFENLVDGSLNATTPGTALNVRCVSGSVYAPGTFNDNGDGTVTDNSNALRWQKCSMGQTNDATCSNAATQGSWQVTLAYCAGLTLAGRSWRLPNLTELHSLIKAAAANPAIDGTAFPGTPSGQYWTATGRIVVPNDSSWYVDFGTGATFNQSRATNSYARCVSTGP